MKKVQYSEYIGKRIGVVEVIGRIEKKNFLIKCDCGNVTEKLINNLLTTHKKGNIVSCGCMRKANISKKATGRISHKKINFTEKQIKDIVDQHLKNISLDTIAKQYGCSQPVIGNVVKNLGYTPNCRRSNLNENFFDIIDTEEKAYWLGYLAADGTIRVREKEISKDGKQLSRGNSIHLKLSTTDEDHLKKLRDVICPNSELKYATSVVMTKKGNISTSYNVILNLYGNYIVSQIIDKGVGPRKTFTLSKPNIDPKFYRHFIRGFFDGDGCCYVKKTTGKRKEHLLSVRYSFACASKDFRDFVSDVLRENGIESKSYGNLNLIVIGGVDNNKRFFEYLYNDSTIYLNRKYEKSMIFVNHINGLTTI